MGNATISFLFSQKILKKIQFLAFTEKVKIINSYVPEKVKIYIEKNLLDELKYFQKKYSFEIKILSDDKFIIPEYKIDLLNKSKKLINTIENVSSIIEFKKAKKNLIKEKKVKTKVALKSKEKVKKTKSKKKIRTLWTRRKKIKLILLMVNWVKRKDSFSFYQLKKSSYQK